MKPKLPSFTSASKYLKEIDRSRVYSNFGPLVKELESRYALYFGVEKQRVVVMSNATLALQGCVEISDQKTWAVPNFTFVATAHAVLQARKKLNLVEVSGQDWMIDLKYLEPNNSGLLPVMPFGRPVNLEIYSSWEHVVIDAAASLGSPPPDLTRLRSGHFIVYSLHATKVLGAGEGALVVCGSLESAEKLRSWSNFGFRRDRISHFTSTNAKLSEISAAYGLASLDEYLIEEKEWIDALNFKHDLLANLRLTNISDCYPGFRPYWIFETKQKGALLQNYLREFNIESRFWWSIPLSKMNAFANVPTIGGDKNAMNLSKSLLGLPLWRDISASQIEMIVGKIAQFSNKR